MADRVTAPSQEELQSVRYLRELIRNIIREIEGGGLDPNTVDALHFRLDWLHGLIARLIHLYGIDEEIVNLIRVHGTALLNVGTFLVFQHQLLPLLDNVDVQDIQSPEISLIFSSADAFLSSILQLC